MGSSLQIFSALLKRQVTGCSGLWAYGPTLVTVFKNISIYSSDKVVNGLEVPDRVLQISAAAVFEFYWH